MITIIILFTNLIGVITNSETGKLIDNVTLYVINKDMNASISDDNGVFNLKIESVQNDSFVYIRKYGFKHKKIHLNSLLNIPSPIIKIDPISKPSNNVISKSFIGKETITKTIGPKFKETNHIGHIETDKYGFEIGIVVPNKKHLSHVISFNLFFYKYYSDTACFRLNFYKYLKGEVGEKINELIVNKKLPNDSNKNYLMEFNLEKNNIYIEDDFFLSIENIRLSNRIGERKRLNNSFGSHLTFKNKSYIKLPVLEKFIRMPFVPPINIKIKTEK